MDDLFVGGAFTFTNNIFILVFPYIILAPIDKVDKLITSNYTSAFGVKIFDLQKESTHH